MNKLALALTLLISLSACSTTGIVGALSAYNTAPQARSMLAQYIGEDEQSNVSLAPHVEAIATLYKKAQDVDSTKSFLEFFKDNSWQVTQSVSHWQSIVNIVGEHSQRTGKQIPQELVTFRNDVESAYRDLAQVIANKDQSATMAKYIDILALLTKLAAASQGVIL